MLSEIIAHNHVLNILCAQSSVPTLPVVDSFVPGPLDSKEISLLNQLVLSELFAFQNPFQSNPSVRGKRGANNYLIMHIILIVPFVYTHHTYHAIS